MPSIEQSSKTVDVVEAPLSGSVSADTVTQAIANAGLPGSEDDDEEDEGSGGFGTVVDSSRLN